MNGLDQLRIAGKGWQGRRLVGLQEVAHRVLWRSKGRELSPGPFLLQGAPDPLPRVQLWTVGRPPHVPDLLRPPHGRGRVRTVGIHEQEVQAVRQGLGEGVHQVWAGLGMARRPVPTAGLPGGGGHGPIDGEPRADVREQTTRWEAAR